MMTLGVHAHWMGQANRASGLRMFLEYVLSLGDVWIAPRADIARWWLDNHESFETGAGEVRADALANAGY